MVWGAFSTQGTVALEFITNKIDSSEYQRILLSRLIPYLRKFRRMNLVFQQDNASVHKSRSTLDWLQRNKITSMEWPSCSPDLNPMENLWGILVRRVYANQRQYQAADHLKAAILHEWNQINRELIQNLISSMPNRIFNVINRGGNYSDY